MRDRQTDRKWEGEREVGRQICRVKVRERERRDRRTDKLINSGKDSDR